MRLFVLVALFLVFPLPAPAQQHVADLGACPLVSGEVLQPCRVGYRTFGRLNADRSNAVLYPTWFTGRSEELVGNVAPGGQVDSTRYFVILVDAFANGVSSSPSNSPTQADDAFPDVTIEDMVRAQHRLVTDVLGLDHLHAVVGTSMGAMQALQWMVTYPDFMDKIVSIVGTPRQTGADKLLWNAQLAAIEANDEGEAGEDDVLKAVGNMHTFALTTPDYLAAMDSSAFVSYQQNQIAETLQYDAHDRAVQLRAMLAHDIYASENLTAETIADHVRADVLIIVARHDHMVNPTPALALADALDAATLVLPGPCGHLAPGCESDLLLPVLHRFLSE